jgi:hypothetical protein
LSLSGRTRLSLGHRGDNVATDASTEADYLAADRAPSAANIASQERKALGEMDEGNLNSQIRFLMESTDDKDGEEDEPKLLLLTNFFATNSISKREPFLCNKERGVDTAAGPLVTYN